MDIVELPEEDWFNELKKKGSLPSELVGMLQILIHRMLHGSLPPVAVTPYRQMLVERHLQAGVRVGERLYYVKAGKSDSHDDRVQIFILVPSRANARIQRADTSPQ